MKGLIARGGIIAAACLCLMLPAGAASRQGQTKMALVTVVADASSPLRDLTAKDFTVTEDNQKRDVLSAALAEEPLSVALLVDTTQPRIGSPPPTQDLRNSLGTFVRTVESQNPNANIALTEFAGAAVPKVSFGAKAGDLSAAINRLYPNQQGGAVLIEALEDAAKLLTAQPAPRRAVVAVDFNSPEDSHERSMKSATEALRKSGATVWSVSVRGSTMASPVRDDVLNKITQANGGLRLMPVDASGLEANLKIVAHSLASQYTVTFARPAGASPKTTKLETTKGAKVQLTPWMR